MHQLKCIQCMSKQDGDLTLVTNPEDSVHVLLRPGSLLLAPDACWGCSPSWLFSGTGARSGDALLLLLGCCCATALAAMPEMPATAAGRAAAASAREPE